MVVPLAMVASHAVTVIVNELVDRTQFVSAIS